MMCHRWNRNTHGIRIFEGRPEHTARVGQRGRVTIRRPRRARRREVGSRLRLDETKGYLRRGRRKSTIPNAKMVAVSSTARTASTPSSLVEAGATGMAADASGIGG
jgi:hypothetical protein